jgi:lysophospholipase L1-like esterase
MRIALSPGEAADPYCLREGEAESLLTGHPWRRFSVIGDSVAEGMGEPTEGYPDQPWADRVAAELTVQRPGFAYRNLGVRNTRATLVRATQLPDALAFEPDLALVACGGFDALSRTYQPDAVDAEIRALIEAFRAVGADVITVSMFDGSYSPAVPDAIREALRDRLHDLAARTRRLAAEFGTVHVDLTDHPASHDPAMYGADGRHGTRRSHAISATETIRRLGAQLASRASVDDGSLA